MRDVPPERIDVDGARLRRLCVDDAAAVASAVAESLDHLRPWMPWADERSTDPAFQRRRLAGMVEKWERREEFEYGIFAREADATALGMISLMTRRGGDRLEIGYWLHVAACGRGLARHATAALTDAGLRLPGVARILVYCDQANARSAAVPRALGFRLLRVEPARATAAGETGRPMVWARDTPIGPRAPATVTPPGPA